MNHYDNIKLHICARTVQVPVPSICTGIFYINAIYIKLLRYSNNLAQTFDVTLKRFKSFFYLISITFYRHTQTRISVECTSVSTRTKHTYKYR